MQPYKQKFRIKQNVCILSCSESSPPLRFLPQAISLLHNPPPHHHEDLFSRLSCVNISILFISDSFLQKVLPQNCVPWPFWVCCSHKGHGSLWVSKDKLNCPSAKIYHKQCICVLHILGFKYFLPPRKSVFVLPKSTYVHPLCWVCLNACLWHWAFHKTKLFFFG